VREKLISICEQSDKKRRRKKSNEFIIFASNPAAHILCINLKKKRKIELPKKI